MPVLQIGRAGRDGLPSKCKLMWSAQDWVKNNMIQVVLVMWLIKHRRPSARHCGRELPRVRVGGSSCNQARHCSGPGSQASTKQRVAFRRVDLGLKLSCGMALQQAGDKSTDLATPSEAACCPCAVWQHDNGLMALPALELCVGVIML